MIGQTISHYRILEKLGEGGMGEVYKAEDTKLHRTVALKFLSSLALCDPDSKKRFITEARAAAGLEHPNICSVHAIDEVDGRMFIAMQYCDGESIRDKVERGPLKLQEVVTLGIDIARGLQEAHDKRIVHRDIKSANVMVTGKGQAKITDFGLAKLVDNSGVTRTGTTLGTAAYMSPEQVAGETADQRSDIWALGVVLYEMLTGRLPFRGEHVQAVACQILNDSVEPITAQRTGVPLELERIVTKCLQKDPSNRYQHADDLMVDLRNVDRSPTPRAPGKRRVAWVLPAVLAAVAIAVMAVWQPFQSGAERASVKNPLADATFRRLTDIAGARDAAISPDGKFVAFVSDHDGAFDIWVAQVETGNVYNRTRGQYGDMRRGLKDVGFSASGSEILSFAISARQGMQSLPLIDGPPRKILRDSVILADWSADGRRVVYYTDSDGDPVFVANADGTDSRAILVADAGIHHHYQRWSLDGEWIYMSIGRETMWEMSLWRVKPDGSQLEQLTRDQLDVAYPVPIDHRTVLFVARSEDGEGPWLWSIDVETRECQRVSIGLENYTSLSASRDGRRLVTTVVDPETYELNLWKVPILDRVATEADVSPLDLPTPRAQAPRFGGDALYFLSSRRSGGGLWKYSDGQLEDVWKGTESALFELPMISPDGETVAIVLKRDGQRQLHLLNPDGSNLRALSSPVDVVGTGSWSPDGKWIVVGGVDADSMGLFKVSVESGLTERISDGRAIHPVWSPRGDLIVFGGKQVSGYMSLLAVRPDGSPFELPDIKVWVRDERFRFLPDGSGVVYMEGWVAAQDFRLLDLSTMESRRLTNVEKGGLMMTFDISPDGRSIVFDRLRQNVEIVMIELPDNAPGE